MGIIRKIRSWIGRHKILTIIIIIIVIISIPILVAISQFIMAGLLVGFVGFIAVLIGTGAKKKGYVKGEKAGIEYGYEKGREIGKASGKYIEREERKKDKPKIYSNKEKIEFLKNKRFYYEDSSAFKINGEFVNGVIKIDIVDFRADNNAFIPNEINISYKKEGDKNYTKLVDNVKLSYNLSSKLTFFDNDDITKEMGSEPLKKQLKFSFKDIHEDRKLNIIKAFNEIYHLNVSAEQIKTGKSNLSYLLPGSRELIDAFEMFNKYKEYMKKKKKN